MAADCKAKRKRNKSRRVAKERDERSHYAVVFWLGEEGVAALTWLPFYPFRIGNDICIFL